MKDEKLFSESVVEEIRLKIQNKGLEGVDTKELLVLIADHFNDSVGNMQNIVNDGVGSIQKIVNDGIDNIQEIGRRTIGALWAIFAGIIASLIAGLIIALLTLK